MVSINDIDMSVRLKNCMRSAKLDNLRQIASQPPEFFMKIRNFGLGCAFELQAIMLRHGVDMNFKK